MNDRIKELKIQALTFAQEKTKGQAYDDYGVLRSDIMTEKFAELIIQECAKISVEADDTMTNQGAASAQAFMDYFGVK